MRVVSAQKPSSDQFTNPDYDWPSREIVGQGGFGKVFKVKNKKSKQTMAIKQIDMVKFDEDYKRQSLINEIGIQKQMGFSPHFVKYYDHSIGQKFTYIISELCDSDLKHAMGKRKDFKIPQQESATIFRQIIQGFKLLIERGYIHRDVKPENILIKNGVHKISDFGFSRKLDSNEGSKIKEVCGTAVYMAPQILMGQEYSSKCDIWSLGLMLYQMIFGFGPWPQRHPKAYRQQILAKPVSFPYGTELHEHTKDFILKSLVIEEENRIGWKQVFSHPFITQKDLGKKAKSIQVSEESVGVLQKVQQSSRRKLVNLRNLFNQTSKKEKLNKNEFQKLIVNVDPSITSYEIDKIFKAADRTNDGNVDAQQFETMFCEVDYRPADDVASRRIQQLIALAKARGLTIRSFFTMFDKNKSGTIDKKEFISFIKQIAPQIQNAIIQQMWDKFDRDQSGQIDTKEFLEELTRGVPDEESQMGSNRERAKRNVECLKAYFNSKGITAKKMMERVDENKSKTLSIDQFGPMVQKINYVISKQEIVDMFKLMDLNQNNQLQLKQIQQFLK